LQRQDLWKIFQGDSILLELVRTPFWLSIVILAEQELKILDWRHLTTEARFHALLNAYIRRMLKRELPRNIYKQTSLPTDKQTISYLVRLSQQMQSESETEFLIEAIQPSWLTNRPFWYFIYKVFNRLLIGIALALSSAIPLYLTFGTLASIITALIGLCLGIATKSNTKIKTVETLKWSWRSFGKGFREGMLSGLAFAEYLAQIRSFNCYSSNSGRVGYRIQYLLNEKGVLGIIFLILGLFFGTGSGIWCGLMNGIVESSDIEEKLVPNQGIRRTATNLFTFMSIWGATVGLFLGLIPVLRLHSLDGVIPNLIVGISFGMAIGLGLGLWTLPIYSSFVAGAFCSDAAGARISNTRN
jgi:uncharacterized integral membrane protein